MLKLKKSTKTVTVEKTFLVWKSGKRKIELQVRWENDELASQYLTANFPEDTGYHTIPCLYVKDPTDFRQQAAKGHFTELDIHSPSLGLTKDLYNHLKDTEIDPSRLFIYSSGNHRIFDIEGKVVPTQTVIDMPNISIYEDEEMDYPIFKREAIDYLRKHPQVVAIDASYDRVYNMRVLLTPEQHTEIQNALKAHNVNPYITLYTSAQICCRFGHETQTDVLGLKKYLNV